MCRREDEAHREGWSSNKYLIEKKDPFRIDGCDFGDEGCPIQGNHACNTMGTCYRAICECTEYSDMQEPPETDEDKFNYVGQTGTNAHNSHLSHATSVRNKNKTSAISEHMLEHHPDESKIYTVKLISTHQSNLERVASEMIWIEKQNPVVSMNRKSGDGSWASNRLIRLTTT